MLAELQIDHQGWVLTLEHDCHWVLVASILLFLLILKVKDLCEVSQKNLQVGFCESFTEANTLATAERGPAH